jgi:4-hydroxybenzoate polyprenyltransferase
VAAAGQPQFSSAVILFSGFVFCWLSGADIIYALMDIDSDRQNNIHSLPARLGADGALRVAAGIHLMAWGILVAVVQTVGGGLVAWLVLALAAVFFVLMYVPAIPVHRRFFPISTLAGMAGALAPMIA